MRTGGFEEGKACLRARSTGFAVYRDSDPVLYRIKFAEHQTGKVVHLPDVRFHHPPHAMRWRATYSLWPPEFQDKSAIGPTGDDNTTIPVHPRQYEFRA